jgi:hypothetical protein
MWAQHIKKISRLGTTVSVERRASVNLTCNGEGQKGELSGKLQGIEVHSTEGEKMMQESWNSEGTNCSLY